MLIGGLSAGALTSCGPRTGDDPSAPIRADAVYANNHYVQGVGYYHAPFRAFFSLPYNHYDAQRQRYFHGGMWGTTPHTSITNLSNPTASVAQQAQALRSDVRRSGFGSTSRHHSTWS